MKKILPTKELGRNLTQYLGCDVQVAEKPTMSIERQATVLIYMNIDDHRDDVERFSEKFNEKFNELAKRSVLGRALLAEKEEVARLRAENEELKKYKAYAEVQKEIQQGK